MAAEAANTEDNSEERHALFVRNGFVQPALERERQEWYVLLIRDGFSEWFRNTFDQRPRPRLSCTS